MADAILVVNLSKGRIGDSACQLLGSFVVSGLQLAAMLQPNSPADCQGDDCAAALQAARQHARAPLAAPPAAA